MRARWCAAWTSHGRGGVRGERCSSVHRTTAVRYSLIRLLYRRLSHGHRSVHHVDSVHARPCVVKKQERAGVPRFSGFASAGPRCRPLTASSDSSRSPPVPSSCLFVAPSSREITARPKKCPAGLLIGCPTQARSQKDEVLTFLCHDEHRHEGKPAECVAWRLNACLIDGRI